MTKTKEDMVVDALRELVGAIYCECKGAYGAGDEGYEGHFEQEIKSVSKVICSAGG